VQDGITEMSGIRRPTGAGQQDGRGHTQGQSGGGESESDKLTLRVACMKTNGFIVKRIREGGPLSVIESRIRSVRLGHV
jgi:hypothetical protein